jgi:hypothetical protein
LKEAEPNAAHQALVELQEMGKLHPAAGTCQPVMTGIEKISINGWQTRLGCFH